MNRLLHLKQEPRALLTAAGYQIDEMSESERCCGFGGLFSIRMPEVSNAMTADKLRQARETEVTTVVTSDPGCLLQMRGLADDSLAYRAPGDHARSSAGPRSSATRATDSGKNRGMRNQ